MCSFWFLFALFNLLSRLSCSFCLLIKNPKRFPLCLPLLSHNQKDQKYFLLFLFRLFSTSFLVASFQIENNKKISLLVLRYSFHYSKNTKIFSRLLRFVVVSEFNLCLGQHLHIFIISISFGCASVYAVMMIFGGTDLMRKFGMNSICFYFCTDAYPHAHVLVCYDRMLHR